MRQQAASWVVKVEKPDSFTGRKKISTLLQVSAAERRGEH